MFSLRSEISFAANLAIARRSGRRFHKFWVISKARNEISLSVAAGNAYLTIHPRKTYKTCKDGGLHRSLHISQDEYNTPYHHPSITKEIKKRWKCRYSHPTIGIKTWDHARCLHHAFVSIRAYSANSPFFAYSEIWPQTWFLPLYFVDQNHCFRSNAYRYIKGPESVYPQNDCSQVSTP